MGLVHGEWCGTRTWPTQCPSCAAPVFFFMCNCGSKVFFDDLGPPWPEHDCDTSWTRKLKRTTQPGGGVSVELRPGITITRAPAGFAVDAGIVSKARNREVRQRPDSITAREPGRDDRRVVIGMLREMVSQVSPLKAFRLAQSAVGHALLGVLGAQAMGKITVHAPSAARQGLDSFTIWTPTALLTDRRIVRGLTVSVEIEGVPIVGRGYAWYCNDFGIIG